jgi:hypothetical protein
MALESLYRRHMTGARNAARDLQESAGHVLRDLDAGRTPHHSLVQSAVQLAERLRALEAMGEMQEIYEYEPIAEG